MRFLKTCFLVIACNAVIFVPLFIAPKVIHIEGFGKQVFQWEYTKVLTDSLPQGYEWVRDTALVIGVDDEFAYGFLKNVVGDEREEVILYYARDGIFFANSVSLKVFSYDGRSLLNSEDNIAVCHGLIKINNATTFYGYDFPLLSKAYVFYNSKYSEAPILFPFVWMWRIAGTMAWLKGFPVEFGALFFILHIAVIWFIGLFFDKFQLTRSIAPLTFRALILIVCEALYVIPGPFIPILWIIGPIVAILFETIVIALPFEKWLTKGHV